MRGSIQALIRGVVMLIAVAALPAAQADGQEGVPIPDAPAPPAPEAPEPPHCICLEEPAADPGRFAFLGTRPARLGVTLGEPATVDGRHGVSLEEVPEGTPAHRAGLRTGDVVVAVNGAELGEDAATRLIDRMSDVEPGDTVTVMFLRDGREQTVRVATEAGSGMRGLAPALRGLAPGLREVALPGRDMDVPIMRAPRLDGLRPGDVILAVGGREVQDPGHARAILASYREGEEITFRIVRDRRPQEVRGRRR